MPDNRCCSEFNAKIWTVSQAEIWTSTLLDIMKGVNFSITLKFSIVSWIASFIIGCALKGYPNVWGTQFEKDPLVYLIKGNKGFTHSAILNGDVQSYFFYWHEWHGCIIREPWQNQNHIASQPSPRYEENKMIMSKNKKQM